MENKDNEAVDMYAIANSVVLDGPITGDIWMGLPDMEYLKNPYFANLTGEENAKKILNEYENVIKSIKQVRNPMLNKKNDYNTKAEIVQNIYQIMVDLDKSFGDYGVILDVLYTRKYEDICNNNPAEAKKIDKSAKKELDKFKDGMDDDITYRKFNEETGRFEAVPIWLLSTEEKLKNPQNQEKYTKVMEKIYGNDEGDYSFDDFLESFNSILEVDELSQLFEKEYFGEEVVTTTLSNYLLDKGLTRDDIEFMTEEEFNDALVDNDFYSSDINERGKVISESINQNIDYINLDKLFLLYTARMISVLDDTNSIENFESLNDCSKNLEVSLFYMKASKDLSKLLLDTHVIKSHTKVGLDYGGMNQKEYNLDSVKKAMAKYSGDIYLSNNSKEMFRDLLYNNNAILWGDEELLKDLKISKEDKKEFLTSETSNLEALYNAGLIDKEFIVKTLEEMKDGSLKPINEVIDGFNLKDEDKDRLKRSRKTLEIPEIVDELSRNGIVSEEDVKKFYYDGLLEFDELKNIELNSDRMAENISDDELTDAYRSYIDCLFNYEENNCKENEEALKEAEQNKNKILMVYRKYKLDNLSEEEKTEKSEELIWDYFMGLGEKDIDEKTLEGLREMYNDRIASFESIRNFDASYLNTFLVDYMLRKGELTLADTMKLKEILSTDEQREILDDVINDKNINDNQKFTLIMNMFFENTPEDTETRLEYMRKLGFQEIPTEAKGQFDDIDKEGSHKEKKEKQEKDEANYAYPDNIKWLLFMNIDKNVKPTVYGNGYVDFYLESYDEHVFEKIYKVDKSRKLTGYVYGKATYLMSDAKYKEYNHDFIKTGSRGRESIDDASLRKIVPKDDRINHLTHSADKNWMRALLDKLDVDLEWNEKSIYTEKEREELDNFVKNFEDGYQRI